MKALLRTILLAAICLSACGGGLELSTQPQTGQGWEFLTWAPTEGDEATPTHSVLTTQAELDEIADTLRPDWASPDQLERVNQSRTPSLSVDFETEVVLALRSNATGNCGGPVYLDFEFTETQLLVEPFQVPPDTDCTTAGQPSVSLFALDSDMLPSSPFGIVVFESETVINLDN